MKQYGIELGYLSWPEGQPARAHFTTSYARHRWNVFLLGLQGKVRTYEPAVKGEDYVLLANNLDAAMNLHARHFGSEQ